MFKDLIAGLTGPVADYFKERMRLKAELSLKKIEGEIKVAEAKANYQVKALETDHEWELESIRNSGWKDEWILLLLSIPLVMAFIPPLVPYVMMGFSALAQTPEWYRWLIMLIFTAIYGIRIWRRNSN